MAKIYLVRAGVGYLDVISHPNLPGVACGYIVNADTLVCRYNRAIRVAKLI